MKKLQKNIYIGIGVFLVFVLIFSMFNTSGAIIDTSLTKVQDTYCKDVNTVANSPIYQCKSSTGNTFYCVDTKQATCQATYQATIWSSCSKVSSCSGTTTSTATSSCSSLTSDSGFNSYLTTSYKSCGIINGNSCVGDKTGYYACQTGKIYYGLDNYGNKDLYCDANTDASFVSCPTGQTCQSNGLCGTSQTGGQIVECSSDYMRCDSNNNIYQCNSGKYIFKENCPNGCEQVLNTNYYQCKLSYNYWCINIQQYGDKCIQQSFNKPTTITTCFNSKEQCLNGVQYYCLSSDRKQCNLRNGNCLEGELSYIATDMNMAFATCNTQKIEMKCSLDSDCNDNNECTTDKCDKNLLGSKCLNAFDANCDKTVAKTCESNPFMSYNKYTTTSGGYLCDFLNIGCSKETTYKCEASLWVWIVGIILLIFVLMILYKIAKKKRWI